MAFSQKGSLFIWLTRSLLALYFSGRLGCLGSWSMVWAASWTWCSRLSWLAVGEQPVLWLVVGEPRRVATSNRGRPSSRMRRNSNWFETRPECRDRPRYRTRSRDEPRWMLEVTRIVGLDEHDVEMNRDIETRSRDDPRRSSRSTSNA